VEGQVFYSQGLFNHANHIARTVDLLAARYPSPGIMHNEVERLRQFGATLWPANNWNNLPACTVDTVSHVCSCFGVMSP
jgi:hypothetical protein